MDHPPSERSKRSHSMHGTSSDKNDIGRSSAAATTTTIPSLVFLCRTVVTVHLERYTPESFRICDIYEWEEIIQLRHAMTQPQQTRPAHQTHHDSLDGHGRLLPAISGKVLLPIEECNEHLNDSVMADTLVWKDCVEYHFKRSVGFLIRPPILFVPWPILVQQIQTTCGQVLSSFIMEDDKNDNAKNNNNSNYNVRRANTNTPPLQPKPTPTSEEIAVALHTLQGTTWNIALLRDTGIGKIVKRLLKQQLQLQQTSKRSSHKISSTTSAIVTEPQIKILQQLLAGWMNLAKNNHLLTAGLYQWKEQEDEIITAGTTKPISSSSSVEKKRSLPNASPTATDHNHHSPSDDMAMQKNQDLQLLEKCLSWRQLYQVLEDRKRHIQATQGQRMREIRNQVSCKISICGWWTDLVGISILFLSFG